MRVIAIGTAVFLVVIGTAAGSGQITSQKPLKAPRPAGVPQKEAGFIGRVACASAQSCAASGLWLYTDQAGKWQASKPPVLPHVSTAVRSLACPSAGRCEALGGGEKHIAQLTESGRQWRAGELPLPANANPKASFPGITLACASAGNCTAAGSYNAADNTEHALLITESNGTWGASTDVPLPPDAFTTFPPPNESFAGGYLNLASCPSAGSCTTVGSYTRQPNGATYPWILDESGGQWGTATGLQLPPDAGTAIDFRGGATSPFMGFSGLSCPSAGNCTAVGGYVDDNSNFQGGIFTERDGTWSSAIEAPMPANAAPRTGDTDPMELKNPLNAVSCAAPGDCAAVGFYVKGPSQTQRGLLLAEHQGTWKASGISLPKGVQAPGGVILTSVSCPAPGDCVAVGYYAGHGKTHGLVVRERSGKWQRAVNAALPKGAAPASRAHTDLDSVTCPSTHFCLAGGYYDQSSGPRQGLLLSLRLR